MHKVTRQCPQTENEREYNHKKADRFLAAGQAREAIFCPIPGGKKITLTALGFQQSVSKHGA